MPRWVQHSKTLVGWRRRFRLNTDPTEVLTGIIPTAQLDQHWSGERHAIWGLYVQSAKTGAGLVYHACQLVAQRKAVLIHRIEADTRVNGVRQAAPIHLFTPLQTYDPTPTAAAIFFPWLQTMVDRGSQPAQLAEAFGVGGYGVALQVVTVNGAPHTAIGPTRIQATQEHCVFWSEQNPPLMLRPFSSVCLQVWIGLGGAGQTHTLDCNWYFSEEEDSGDVG